MRPLKPFSAVIALGVVLANAPHAFGCSDPEQHKIHMRQEMEARLRAQSAGGGSGAPSVSPTPSSALDSADAFFKTPSAPASQSESRRRR